ncbi:MAG: hypothetical protein NDI81_01125 [Desulfobacula sp.]|nr:hypothetical protein [Desulfobacula sp.]
MKQPVITINPDIQKTLTEILEIHQEYGAPNPQENLNDLVNFILGSVIDGFNNFGCWERDFVNKMGLLPNVTKYCD